MSFHKFKVLQFFRIERLKHSFYKIKNTKIKQLRKLSIASQQTQQMTSMTREPSKGAPAGNFQLHPSRLNK